MTFAENLETTMKALLEGVLKDGYNAGFEAGKAEGGGSDENLLQYATDVYNLFYMADFGGKDHLIFNLPNCPENISTMFARAVGFKKLTFNVPTATTYNGYRFSYGYSGGGSTIEELVLPDGIKFSNFKEFVRHCTNLKTITGRIDLSEVTDNTSCFYGCSALEDIQFVPNSIVNSISLNHSPNLSDDSVTSIIGGLATATGQTLSLHETTKAKLTESQIATITTTKGWTLA